MVIMRLLGSACVKNNTGSITISLPTDSVITNAFLYWESLENNSTLSDTGNLNGNPYSWNFNCVLYSLMLGIGKRRIISVQTSPEWPPKGTM